MSYYLDYKYINLISSGLEYFSWKKKNVATCRCPICGDSKKNKYKTRFYFYEVKGQFLVKCHNCGYTSSFDKYLENTNNVYLQEYRMEKFKDRYDSKIKQEEMPSPVVDFTKIHIDVFPTLDSLSLDHPAVEYCNSRKLPRSAMRLLRYAEDFSIVGNMFGEDCAEESRILIPFYDLNNDLFAVQGRSLQPNAKIRYLTLRKHDCNFPKLFGINTIHPENTNYCVEGPIDSMFLDNAFAMAGSGLDPHQIPIDVSNTVFVYDNEPRNFQILKFMKKIIEGNHKIVVWPSDIKQKDINDMVLAGLNPKEIIDTNTYSGLAAQLTFNKWKAI